MQNSTKRTKKKYISARVSPECADYIATLRLEQGLTFDEILQQGIDILRARMGLAPKFGGNDAGH